MNLWDTFNTVVKPAIEKYAESELLLHDSEDGMEMMVLIRPFEQYINALPPRAKVSLRFQSETESQDLTKLIELFNTSVPPY